MWKLFRHTDTAPTRTSSVSATTQATNNEMLNIVYKGDDK